ncbi:septum formation protein Maf [Candidatus Peregrinibacteria bacterium]|nr:septum formation protein Maf [Candidatus Peregrinibacteria bacterium]
MRIILASQSPFRKHALEVLGLAYETLPSNIDESAIRHTDPSQLALLLSQAKARKIGETEKNAIIIAADLFVVHQGKIIEKPRDEADAQNMLKNFSNQSFQIISGLAVYNSETDQLHSSADSCQVKFRELTDFEIADYIARFPALKCAGAFEADGLLRFAEHIEGNYNFKAGLAVNKLIEFLRINSIKV